MIDRMAGREYGTKRRAFGLEDLAVIDVELSRTRLVFVDSGGKMRVVSNQIGYATRVIPMPMG